MPKNTELRILITDRSRPTLDRLKRYRDEEGLPSLAEAARQILKIFLIHHNATLTKQEDHHGPHNQS